MISSIILLNPKVPLNYVRIHIGVVSLPPILALTALVFQHDQLIWGPWRFNSLTLLLAVFVLTMGLIVQRYSIHYLLGDRSYRKYFSLLTLTTVAGSLAWLSDDLRLLIICWGTTLLGLTLMILLKKEWLVARRAASFMGRLFIMSWLLFLIVILWVSEATGYWQLSRLMAEDSLIGLESWEETCYQSLTNLICCDSCSSMAFPALVIRLSRGSNTRFSHYACRDCECWGHHLNFFYPYI